MFCWNDKVMRVIRGDSNASSTSSCGGDASTANATTRDRSKSVFVHSASIRNQSEHDVSAFKLFNRRASSALSYAADVISRKGFLPRRFGSLDYIRRSSKEEDGKPRKFRKEDGISTEELNEVFGNMCRPLLENPENEIRWYFRYFLGYPHQNFIGADYNNQPFIISAVKREGTIETPPHFRLILFRKNGPIKRKIDYRQTLSVNNLAYHFPELGRLENELREVTCPKIQKDLLLLEEHEGFVHYKIGVIYMKSGQNSDNQMLGNEYGSSRFDDFLALLGDQITLRGFDKYKGGLDVKSNMTGQYSVFTTFEEHEIMFHVSTLLPYSKEDKQQIERKRHIGNDIVNIIFVDPMGHDLETAIESFKPSFIKSQFTHIFIVVSYSPGPLLYGNFRLCIYVDDTVPVFGPHLPFPPVFRDRQLLRNFILSKAINGEKATYKSPVFLRKKENTLDMLLHDLYDEHVNNDKTISYRRTFPDEVSSRSQLEENARLSEFLRFGQLYKLEAIMRREASTTSDIDDTKYSLFRKLPWEIFCFHPVFSKEEIVCGDSWDHNKLLLVTNSGTYLVEEGISVHKCVFDKSVKIRQINVIEEHGLLVLRIGDFQDNIICVLRLSLLSRICNDVKPYAKSDIMNYRMNSTSGCHLYSINRPGATRMRMVVAIEKRLLLFQWKHVPLIWFPDMAYTDMADEFLMSWEVTLSEVPTKLAIIEGLDILTSRNSKVSKTVVVGIKNRVELLNGINGSGRKFYQTSGHQQIRDVFDLYEDQEMELLLCYGNTCHFEKVHDTFPEEKDKKDICDSPKKTNDFHWDIAPTQIVCSFPYMLGFGENTIEIRLLINGSLIGTIQAENITLLSSKHDIFFCTTSPIIEFKHWELIGTNGLVHFERLGNSKFPPLRIYRIITSSNSISSSNGTTNPEKASTSSKLAVVKENICRSIQNSPISKKGVI